MADLTEILAPGGGGDYVTMATAEANGQGKVGAGDTYTLKCRSGTDTTKVVWGGWTCDLIIIEVDAGHEHGGVIGQGYRLAPSDTSTSLEFNNSGVSGGHAVKGITVEHTGATGRLMRPRASNPVLIEEAFLINENVSDTSTAAQDAVINATASVAHTIRNSLLIGGSFSLYKINSGAIDTFENVTCVDYASKGIDTVSGVGSVITNCALHTTRPNVIQSLDINNASYTVSTSATTDGAEGTTVIDGTAFVNYTGDKTGDYIPAASGLLDGTGAYLASTDPDIAGNARGNPNCEIGAYEIAGAAPGVTFDGPNIVAQSGTENVLFSFDENAEGTVASRFTGATSYAYAPGSDQPAGLTVNPTTGNLEGTPTAAGTFDVTIEGSD